VLLLGHPDSHGHLQVAGRTTDLDPAVDGPRWRHPTTLVRLRPDLHPTDLTTAGPAPAAAATRPTGPGGDTAAGGNRAQAS
jgi:hypothetical protein